MLQRANALRRVAARGTIGRLALLRSYEIDAGAGGEAAGATQCLGGGPAVGGAIAGQDTLFSAAEDSWNGQLGDARRGIHGSVGGAFGDTGGALGDRRR